ncbi:CRAL-TRIO domain-containing protein [Lasiosphaeris hirsuta]|uniref:CRAL-TRIO domain-containing protein n=1 Tax=Lasiosphaeris hirsuta TaxID=260670 RepID=A0AA40B0K1_9PEZI|nr:CRAL-TRIO domain-containing protein [Lasiosphaeris hirsuta]
MAEITPTDLELDPKYDDYEYPTKAPIAQNGHAGYLTPLQQAQVHQLRLMLEAEGFTKRLDTLTLLRFLRARKFDVNLSKQMFVECEKWRKETNLDETVPIWEYPEKEDVFKYYPQYYHKTDKDGRPVYIEQLGGIDLTAMYKITTAERMITNLAVEYERLSDPRLPACSRKSGYLLETCCTIMDLKGVGLTKAPQVFGYVKQVSGLSQNYYPERLGRLYLINAPWGFSTVWNVIKGWLDPVTVQKIHVLGGSYQKQLLEQVPAENLPKQFGGVCECAGGCALSDMGPWREKEWARPAKWEQTEAKADATITNTPGEIKEGAAAGGTAPAIETADVKAPAPAAA